MITPNWQMWDFEMWDFDDIEIGLRDHASKNDLHYDPKHPLSVLPDDAAKKALEAAGSSPEEIAEHMPAAKKTVAGWFRPGRNPSRSTVVENIVPAICEAYVRHNEDDFFKFYSDRAGYVFERKRPSRAYLQMVQHRAFLLLTTGKKETEDERAFRIARQLDAYHREVLRYAAASLQGSELEDLSHSAIHVLKSHACNTLADTGSSDALSRAILENEWAFEGFSQADSRGTDSGEAAELEGRLSRAADELGSAAASIQLNDMSDGELESLSALIDQIRERRYQDMILEAEQQLEWGDDGNEADDEVWNH